MRLKIIEILKHILSEHRFYYFSIIFLLGLLVYNRYEILIVEKKRLEIDKELYQLQVKFERRQKEYNEKESERIREFRQKQNELPEEA